MPQPNTISISDIEFTLTGGDYRDKEAMRKHAQNRLKRHRETMQRLILLNFDHTNEVAH